MEKLLIQIFSNYLLTVLSSYLKVNMFGKQNYCSKTGGEVNTKSVSSRARQIQQKVIGTTMKWKLYVPQKDIPIQFVKNNSLLLK